METQIFSPWQNIIFKKSSKRNQNPSRYYNSLTNLKFQHKPKYNLSKILLKNRPITEGPKSLELLYSIKNLNTISLPSWTRPINRSPPFRSPCSPNNAWNIVVTKRPIHASYVFLLFVCLCYSIFPLGLLQPPFLYLILWPLRLCLFLLFFFCFLFFVLLSSSSSCLFQRCLSPRQSKQKKIFFLAFYPLLLLFCFALASS